jgi:long-chain fatty acid transport protein
LAAAFNGSLKQILNLYKRVGVGMKRTLISFAVISAILGATSAQAGGLDRSGQGTSIILKEGNLLEVAFVSVDPTVSGTYTAAVGGGDTGNVAPSYSFSNFAIRTDISDNIGIAVIHDQPYGALVDWKGGFYNGTKADVESTALTALVSYGVADNVTVYGGLKSQSIKATVSVPLVRDYELTTSTSSAMGTVLGAAFEKPEIALRIALTYHAKVSHDMAVVETTGALGTNASTTSFDSPAAFNLDFQTGVAKNTLVFGTIRHVKWAQFSLEPANYKTLTTGPLKDYDDDTTSYSIGVGRKFTDQWSAAVTYGTEAALGGFGGPLGPTDAYSKIGLGATYNAKKLSVTVGVQQVDLGDIQTALSSGTITGTMSGNTTQVTAVKVGYKF